MNVWRLVAYHKYRLAAEQVDAFIASGQIAIGWSRTGDLRERRPASPATITSFLRETEPTRTNSHLGGPSLWRFYREVEIGDLIIVTAKGQRKCVMRVTGDYQYLTEAEAEKFRKYRHSRSAERTDISAEKLWQENGSKVDVGESIRWTFAKCGQSTSM